MLALSCPATLAVTWPWIVLRASFRRAVAGLAATAIVVSAASATTSPATVVDAGRALILAPISVPAIGYGLAHGGHIELRGGLIVVAGMESGYGPRSGFVVGDVFLTRRTDIATDLLIHESKHADQWATLGIWFPVAYFGSDALTGPGAGNVFEVSAGLEDGGYDA